MRRKPQIPDACESAVLLLLLIQTREGATRVRLSEMTLKRLWTRHRLTDDFLDEVKEWLFRAGWALFYAKTTYAAVRTNVVPNWPRLSSKRLAIELKQIEEGVFDFERYIHLVDLPNDNDDEDYRRGHKEES
jgi:hypothetical protein